MIWIQLFSNFFQKSGQEHWICKTRADFTDSVSVFMNQKKKTERKYGLNAVSPNQVKTHV